MISKESSSVGTTTVAALIGGGVVAALTTTTAIGCWLYYTKRNQQSTRRACLQCYCGKVKAEIYQPASNYKYAEPANLQCACNDCMGYCKAVLKEGSSDESFQEKFFDPAIPTILFYDSEIVLTEGKENLLHMKLSPKTENRRVYSKCCGTPIAICPDHSYLNLVYSNLLVPTTTTKDDNQNETTTKTMIPYPSDILYGATCCLHSSNLDETCLQQTRIKHPKMKIIPTIFAPIEITKILSRLILLLIPGMGQKGPGNGFPLGEKQSVVMIGYQSITDSLSCFQNK